MGQVAGTVKDGEQPETAYVQTMFRSDGKLELPIVRSPLDESCLACTALGVLNRLSYKLLMVAAVLV